MRLYVVAALLCAFAGTGSAERIAESARNLPLLNDVDVVVVGGTYGGIGAAVAAKEAGASVFLVAPRPALGEEVTTVRKLWADGSEGAFEKPVFKAFIPLATATFTYTSSVTPNAGHSDPNNTVLSDGRYSDASTQSVQFDSDVTLTVTTAAGAGALNQVLLYSFYRANGFATASLSLQSSTDGTTFTDVAGTCDVADVDTVTLSGTGDPVKSLTFRPAVPVNARYFKITCTRQSGLSRQLLAELFMQTANAKYTATTPLNIQKALDSALLGAKIPFLTGSQVTGVLRDGGGAVAGIVIANRNGRQAIRAKTVIDATEWASAARAGGVAFRAPAAESTTVFSRVVICMTNGLPALPSAYTIEQLLPPVGTATLSPNDLVPSGAVTSFGTAAYRISRSFPFASPSYPALAAIEKIFRDDTWASTTIDASEKLAFTPPDQIVTASQQTGDWPGAGTVSLDAFTPESFLYITGPCADVSRTAAAMLLRPGTEYLVGKRIGSAAASAAAARGTIASAQAGAAATSTAGDIRERLTKPLNIGLAGNDTVASLGADLTVLTNVDVVVVGTGTAGAPATIAAARQGKKVLALEYLFGMGGTTVDSRIGRYYHGNIRGFTSTVDAGWQATGSVFYTAKAEWFRETAEAAGARVWFGTFAEGVLVEGSSNSRDKVAGVIVALPDGTRGIVRASAVIDATGNADITAAAGGATQFINANELALQGSALCPQELGNSYINTDVGFIDSADAGDLAFFALRARLGMGTQYTPGNAVTAGRERRRIVGDTIVTELDILRGRRWTDTITHSKSNFDLHSYTSSDVFMFYNHSSGMSFNADLPYRALLPATLEGVLTTGLGISATRDAMPILRMQPDVQNEGYAAGLAAAMAATVGTGLRGISIPTLQQALIDIGNLDSRVLTDADNPVTASEITGAVTNLTTDFFGLESILSDTATALPLLRAEYAGATAGTVHQLAVACTLALLGDSTGNELLLAQLNGTDWDTGYNFKGLGQYGRSTSIMDAILFAISKSGNPRVIPILSSLIGKLVSASSIITQLSHFRMAGFAAESLRSTLVLPALLDIATNSLAPTTGWKMTNDWTQATKFTYASDTDDWERTRVLRELTLGRVLYRMGDPDGIGSAILNGYALDPRAAYAEHARAVLAAGQIATDVGDTGSVWTSTLASDNWSNPSAWQGGIVASGITATATFAADPATTQTVSLGGKTVTLGSLALDGASNRTFTDGAFILGGVLSEILVGANGTATFDANFTGYQIRKTGSGTLALKGKAILDDGMEINEGKVSFANGAAVYQPYVINDAAVGTPSTGTGYGYSFTIVNGPLWVTHLGCYDSTGAGFAKPMQTYLSSGNSIIAAVQFVPKDSSFLRGGYRFLRLAKPCRLENGTYAIRSFGFDDTQTCRIAASGDQIATLDNADGRLTFGSSLMTGTSATAFTATLAGTTAYSASAASLLLTPVDPEQSITGSLQDNAAVEIATPVMTTGGLAGTGTVTVTRSDVPVSLSVNTASEGCAFNGAVKEGTGRIGLVKDGPGTLSISGTNTFSDGVYCRKGLLELDSINAIGSAVPLLFGEPLEDINGRLRILDPDATVTNPIRVTHMHFYNNVQTGLEAVPGETLTVSNTSVTAYDPALTTSGIGPEFSFIATDAAGPTRIHVEDVTFDYIDLVSRVDGTKNGDGDNCIIYDNLRASSSFRKFVAANSVSNTIGGTVVVSGTNTIECGWLDLTGSGTRLMLSNGVTMVTSNFRCPAGIVGVADANGQLFLGPGTRLVAQQIPNSTLNTTNMLCVFDGGTLQLKNNSQADYLLPYGTCSNCPPCQILEGGLTLDLEMYDNKFANSLRIRHPLTSPAAGVPGPLTITNANDCKLCAPMSYNGPTIVKSGTLCFDFTMAPGSGLTEILQPGTALQLDGGNVSILSSVAGKLQRFASIVNTSEANATSTVPANCEIRTGALAAGRMVKDGAGTLTVCLSPTDNSYLRGSVDVKAGTFRVTTADATNAPALATDGSFEPAVALYPLNATDRGGLDRRGSRDSLYFSTNLTSWTFDKSDSVGICKRGSYFTSTAADGDYCTFLRGTSAAISRTLTAETGRAYTLAFSWKPRDYAATLYQAQLTILLDGAVVYTTASRNDNAWQSATVELGELAAGTHTIAFKGGSSNVDALLDNVRIGTIVFVNESNLPKLSDSALTLKVSTGATLNLDFTGTIPIGAFYIDGVKHFGIFSSATYPSFITGSGSYRCLSAGTMAVFR